MKTNYLKEIQSKSFVELNKELDKLRTELARLKLQDAASRPKDTNIIPKTKRKIAQILTLLNNPAISGISSSAGFNRVNKQVKNNKLK